VLDQGSLEFLVVGTAEDVAKLIALPIFILMECGLTDAARAVDFIETKWWKHVDQKIVISSYPSHSNGPYVPLSVLPRNVVAIVGSDSQLCRRVAEAWSAQTGDPGPQTISTEEPHEIMPALARELAGALMASRKQLGEALVALSRTRVDFEETREAMFQLEKTLAARPPGVPRVRTQVVAGNAVVSSKAANTEVQLEQSLETSVRGIAGVELLVVSPGRGDGSILTARLVAAESETLLGSWVVPANVMSPGWLKLLFPTPINMRDETAVISITLEAGPAGQSPAIQINEHQEPLGWCLWRDGTSTNATLCCRILEAPIGSFKIAPDHWIWSDSVRRLTRPDTGLWLSPDAARTRVLSGQGKIAFDGSTSAFQFLVDGEEPLAIAIGVPVGGPCGTAVAHFAMPEHHSGVEVGLSYEAVDESAAVMNAEPQSGWKQMPENGACIVGLSLSSALRGVAVEAIVRVRARSAVKLSYVVELEGLQLFDRSQDTSLPAYTPASKREGRTPVDSLVPKPVSVSELPRISVRDVLLVDHLVKPDLNYEHLQLALKIMRPQQNRADEFGFKLSRSEGHFSIEFRETDVGGLLPECMWQLKDDFGRFFVLYPTESDIGGLVKSLSEEQSKPLLDFLTRLPEIIDQVLYKASADEKSALPASEWKVGANLFADVVYKWADQKENSDN